MQADTNEVMAASVVYLSNVDVDRPLSKAAWNNSQALRHFSILRKLDGVPFPAGATSLLITDSTQNSSNLLTLACTECLM